jgi:hypothetical protein
LANVGVPPLHILRAHNGLEYRFYELNGDLAEALHFRHFEQTGPEKPQKVGGRIRLKEEVQIAEPLTNPAHNRIRIVDEKPDEKVIIKSSKKRVQIKDQSDVIKMGKSQSGRTGDKEPTHQKKISIKPRQNNVKVH